MKRFFVFCSLALGTFACNKDKFQTKPQIEIKSTNTNEVGPNGTYSVILGFTDKEGDVSDSLIIVRERINLNGPIVPPPYEIKIPVFPNTSEGEIQVDFPYNLDITGTAKTSLTAGIPAIPIPGTGTPPQKENDTLSFKFIVRDKAGTKSDTASSSVIVIRI